MRTASSVARPRELLGFAVRRMLSAETAVLAEFQLVRRIFLVLGSRVIALLALGASQSYDVPHVRSSSPLPDRGGGDMYL